MKNNNPNAIQRYFSEQREIVDRDFHSVEGNFQYSDGDYDMADGDGDGDYDEDYDGVDGQFQYFDNSDGSWSAAGASMQSRMPARQSQPYIIEVQNTGASNLTNVTVGPAYTQLYETSPAFGNSAGVVITSGIPDTTFKQWLATSVTIPYVVGMSIVTGLGDTDSEANAQAQVVVKLTESLADGNLSARPLIFQKDSYQNQNNIVANHTAFKVDQFLTFTIATLYAGATWQIKLYPAENAAITRQLGGAQPLRNYSAPNVINAQRLQLMQGGQQRRQAPARRAPLRRG